VPRLLWSHDEGEGGWVVLVFEYVEGRNPVVPWLAEELDETLVALATLSGLLTPSSLPPSTVGNAWDWSVVCGGYWRRLKEVRPARLDAWSAQHLDQLADLEAWAPSAVAGDALLHRTCGRTTCCLRRSGSSWWTGRTRASGRPG